MTEQRDQFDSELNDLIEKFRKNDLPDAEILAALEAKKTAIENGDDM